RHALTFEAGHLFARLGASAVRDVRPGRDPVTEDAESVIVCLKDGKERWRAHALDAARKEFAVFEGAPLVAGERCYVAASRFEGDRVVTAVHCYPAFAEEGRPLPLWKVDVCETRELQTAGTGEGRKARARHHLLTLAAGRVTYCSHSGVVAALDPVSGARVWAVRYPRREAVEVEDEPSLRDLAPPLAAEGRLYVAPADSDRLLCLDPASGAQLWQRDRLDVVHLLGVGGGRLIFTTWRNPAEGRTDAGGLRAIDARTGRDDAGWTLPDDGGGLIPFGRGQLAGGLVLWPTFRAPVGRARPSGVVAVRQEDGRQPDNPALLHRLPAGNLVYAGGVLLVTDREAMYAFVPQDAADAPGDPAREKLGQLLREKRFDAVLADAALCRLDARDERGLPQSAAALAGRAVKATPLVPETFGAVDIRLRRDEAFLPLAGGEAFLAARPGAVARRTAKGVAWETAIGFTPTWAAAGGGLFVVAGAGGVAGLTADGAEAWHWPPPALPRYPASPSAAVRVHADVTPAEPLGGFRLHGGTLLLTQGGRLFALDAVTGRCRWCNEASVFGRVLAAWPVGDAVLTQVSGQRVLIDAARGGVGRRDADSRTAWPREPVAVDGDAVVVEAERVRRVGGDGTVRWEHRWAGKTTRTGEPPFVMPHGGELVAFVPENVGLRLRFLDAATGAARA
ncbi:MAG: PQQ-binding-like beta-propeller repeat protein, partial [Gemmataceae bacterium]